jgi:prepilin-type N-terminal cleavage/methylation domain-containing protein
MINIKNKGFTLIELLVVIAIIGILSSVVLVSLSSARNKGKDASAIGSLNSMRAQAELTTDGNGNYAANLFTATGQMLNLVKAVVAQTGNISTSTNTSATTSWAVSTTLNSGSSFCVDSTGKAASTTRSGQACN